MSEPAAAVDGQATRPRKRTTKSRAKPKVERVPVPCCCCGEPTGLKVPKSLFEEVEIVELCKACR